MSRVIYICSYMYDVLCYFAFLCYLAQHINAKSLLCFQALRVSMTKHPSSLKLQGELKVKNEGVTDTAVTLYEGPVRGLCPLAPNNVNTMAVASMAAGNLGFDKVRDRHIIILLVHLNIMVLLGFHDSNQHIIVSP